MQATWRSAAVWTCGLLAVVLAANGDAFGEDAAGDVRVLENTAERIVLQYDLTDFSQTPVSIDGYEFADFRMPGASPLKIKGAPALPFVCRSIIIPDDAEMAVNILKANFYDISDVDVAPSKGYISRQVDPDSVPYTFGPAYETDAFYPGEAAALRAPYILRDYRGTVVEFRPLQCNPVTHTVRVYTSMLVEVVRVGPGQVNVLDRPTAAKDLSLAFHQIYNHHFINYGSVLSYSPLDEDGDMLIICHDEWLTNVQPLVDHKNSFGLETTVVGVSTIGNNATAIKNHIQDVYDAGNLAFVLLVGDVDEVQTPTAVSGHNGASDPSYSLLAGNDNYPDIIVGRFSAGSAAQVNTQVERTIEYELMPASAEDWFWRGVGVASAEGTGDDGEYDWEHVDNVRTDLLAHGYTEVDQIYDPGASGADVSAALNAGRGIVNYCGHGSITSWGTTHFSVSGINALVNENMLPFIVSVACNNGEFESMDACFAEAWLRARNNGEPTGAIGCYASSITQPWNPPMEGQDEFNLLYIAGDYNSYGALCFAGSCSMMDKYPGSGNSWGTGAATFRTWHIFGDPSLRVVGQLVPPSGLRVTPDNDLRSAGPIGGPFAPASITYQLENRGEQALDYAVTCDPTVDWLTLSANSVGTLPGYGTADVTVEVNNAAETLGGGWRLTTIQITNTTDHKGDTARAAVLAVGDATRQYFWPLDIDPGWSTENDWAWGQPTGDGGANGYPDPTSGYTGDSVYGFNLNGDYSNWMSQYHLTTTAIDCTDMVGVQVAFRRWLGVQHSFADNASVSVSTDGSEWFTAWQNVARVDDDSWVYHEVDISAVADNQPTVYVRWTMGPTDFANTYCGWNIDDVEILAVLPAASIPGDLNCDGNVNGFDIDGFVMVIGDDLDGYYAAYPGCNHLLADVNGDGEANGFDIDPFVSLLGG